ncbi:ImmA/IrrE family metallo-endopeptidase [Priestia megaterium]|uniref:ImmA/IrrE family metallo-endopeptidase n=1 Tax=Priestia megaterium TaxID=1404 RepID=UPI00317602C7
MNNERRAYIAEVANTIREAMEINYPVDLEKLVENLGGKLSYENYLEENMEAMITKKDNSFEITIDRNKAEKRRRFSIAHEIGHLFLHMGYLVNPEKWNNSNEYVDSVYYRFGYSIEESEANEFAACLLMPANEFRKVAYNNLDNGQFNIQPIADYFDVSQEAAINRGKFIGLFRG